MKTFKQFFTESNYDIFSIQQGDDEPSELGTVPDKGLQSIQKIVRANSNEKVVDKILKKNLYDEKSFIEGQYGLLVDYLGDLDVSFLKILSSNKLPKLVDNKIGQLSQVSNKVKIPFDVVDNIFNFTPVDAGGSNVGRGEILLALLFKDVTNTTGGGDLKHGNSILEIKGVRARLGQQPGRGTVGVDQNDFVVFPDQSPQWREDILNASLAGGGRNWDTAKLLSNVINSINNPTTIKHFTDLLHKLYPKGNVNVHLNDATSIQDPVTAKKTLFKINLDHYFTKGNVEELLIFDKTTNYIVMTKEEAFDHINSGKFTCGNFLIGDWAPNVRVIW